MLKDYADGSDLTLLNNFYLYPKRDEDGKWDTGSMTMIYRDNTTGKKYCETIENPSYEYYKLKPGIQLSNHELFVEENMVDKITCDYKDLTKSIAEQTGNLDFYKDNIREGNRRANNELHTLNNIFNSDTNIEDHYRYRFSKRFTNEPFPLKKSYFDIEADVINAKGDFVEMGECPINAVTIIFEDRKELYTLVLRNPKNPQIEEFEKSIGSDLFNEIKAEVRKAVGGWKQEIRFGLDNFDFKFLFYDEDKEINLIKDLFKMIMMYEPDFVMAWNMAFDIPYIIERIKVLGYNPEDIMCDPRFSHKVAKYFIDTNNENDLAERGDYAQISMLSVFICQMIQFASRRKGQSAFPQFNLDFIGEVVTGVKKYDYSHITTQLAELPWKNYKTFVIYNIIDTIVQKCIEAKTGDIDYTFSKALINNTRYAKVHRQTVYLVNRGCKEFYNDNEGPLIICNNNNRKNEKPGKYPGAFVANPLKLNDYAKIVLNGKPVNLLDNLIDFDYKSLYPSEMREFNIAPNTQIGKIIIPEQIWKDENQYKYIHFDRGGKFIEDLHSHVWLEFCTRWFKLADYGTLYKEVKEFFANRMTVNPIKYFNNNNFVGVRFYDNAESNYVKAIEFDSESKTKKAIIYNKPMGDAGEKVIKYINERKMGLKWI